MSLLDILSVLARDALWAGIAAVGFGFLFNVPRRYLPVCALLGAAGFTVRHLLTLFGASIEVGTLAGAVIVGLGGYTAGRQMQAPTTIFTITGSIPMVPGVFAYRTMLALLQVTTAAQGEAGRLIEDAGVNAIRTGIVLAALAIGIAFPSMLLDRQKPVV